MLVRFWGTRGSIAKPGPATVRYGGNTSCVEVRSSSGTLVVLDCGTGAHGLGQSLLKTGPRPLTGHLLIGHTHWDHIQGFPFFAPLFVPGNVWHVYGPRGVGSCLREALSGQMQYAYFPVTLEALGATLHYHDLVEGTLQVGDVQITTQYLNHPALTLGYRLEADGATVVYSTDHEPHSALRAIGAAAPINGEERRHAGFLTDADLVIHDCQYTAEEYPAKRGWGHSTVEYAVDAATSAGVRRLALFHHDPMRSDDAIDALVASAQRRVAQSGGKTEIFAAAEGLEVELHGESAVVPQSEARNETARANPNLKESAQAVLVAIDDPQISRIVADAVAEDGLRLLTVDDGNAIPSMIRSDRPSLILFQRGWKGCDSLDLFRRIRSDRSEFDATVPIVVVRTADDAAEHQREVEAGVTGWLHFPFSGEYVRTRVRAWVLREACRWTNARLPPDEQQRVRRLRRSGLLDTGAEERFDRFTRIAAALFDVPIALVTLIDEDRQWFKGRTGLTAAETARDSAFCAHAILGNHVMQVPDAFEDDRFADNPFVIGEPRVRFYAGAPLSLGEGSPVGTLCVIDHRVRNLDEQQLRLLSDLSKLVEQELRNDPSTLAAATIG